MNPGAAASGLDTFTLVHILISLTGICTGLVVAGGWASGRHLAGWTGVFLVTTALTSVTGFFFPLRGFTPALAVGILSLLLLTVAVMARYGRRLAGGWGALYVVTALAALYLNVFVLVAQLFQKTPALRVLAPTQTEPAFAAGQGAVFLLFLVLGVISVRSLATAARLP